MHLKSQESQLALVHETTDSLVLSDQLLSIVSERFNSEVNAALTGKIDSNPLPLYPTFIDQVPDGCERGKYLALDLGGTNFRVLLMHLKGNHKSSVSNESYSISQELMQGDAEDLFDYIALCLFNFVKLQGLLGHKLMLGFTVSFPCRQLSRRQAVLTKWTKGFSCANAVGHKIGDMLNRAISKHEQLHIEVAAIVNDTTGTLISCAYQEPDCRMGVIVGTGVNICYMESNCADQQMIINTEVCAFGSGNNSLDFVRTEWDMQVDKRSINCGHQFFEKMTSGMYLSELVRTIVVDLVQREILNSNVFCAFKESNCFSTSFISQIELDHPNTKTWPNTQTVLQSMGIFNATSIDCECLHLICSRVSRRSAHLNSAVITSLLRRMNRTETVVGVDGSVYRCHPHYSTLMHDKIAQLLSRMHSGHCHFRLVLAEDGSGRGAALVAALPLHHQ